MQIQIARTMLSRALSVALLGMASGSALAQVPEQPDAQAKAVEQPDAQSQPATPGPTAAADAAPAPAASGAAADTQTTEMEPI